MRQQLCDSNMKILLDVEHEIYGHHTIFAEHAASSSVACSYVGSLSSSTTRNSDSVDDPNFNLHWNTLTGHNEIFILYALPTIRIQHHSWGLHSPNFPVSNSHISNTDPTSLPAAALRSSNAELDAATRPSSFWHHSPFEHGSRGGSSFVSSVFDRYPGGGAHMHDRIWPSLAYYRHQHRFHQQRFNRPGVPAPVVPGVRGMAPMTPAVPQPDQIGGFYVYP
ncbi:E3 ubiquitin-protein ligase RFI2-like isoform X2 [Hibiscus syriacus]|uniref:E3 ubiquitin-protein ligase RFI2-like isoform X2 n=1 Tax=Hibiscus syriacus TaxID=106335 RepID=UPI001921D970|nr:E3 ubiquitin-protein ligase RFI2-like isoform X2 [Hibiscus syriacus]